MVQGVQCGLKIVFSNLLTKTFRLKIFVYVKNMFLNVLTKNPLTDNAVPTLFNGKI